MFGGCFVENSLSILNADSLSEYVTADETELVMLEKASKLMMLDYPEHSLLELWNASIHNLRRRVELYSIDIFLSTISSMNGRKTYKREGDSISERWDGIDDAILLDGASQIGVLNKKTKKALEMVNWMRNHASQAHDNVDSVTKVDVLGLVYIIKHNLFNHELPDPVH